MMAVKKGSMDLANIGGFEEVGTVELIHPTTDEVLVDDSGKPFSVTVYSPTSAKYKQLIHEQTNRRIQKASRSRNITMTAEQMEAQQMDLVCKVVKEWNLVYKGEVPEYSAAKAKEIFTDFPWIYEQVTAFVDDRRNFLAN